MNWQKAAGCHKPSTPPKLVRAVHRYPANRSLCLSPHFVFFSAASFFLASFVASISLGFYFLLLLISFHVIRFSPIFEQPTHQTNGGAH
jgi:hypothetical protein